MKALFLALALCMASAAAAEDPGYSQAVKDYRAGQWSSAYGRFIVLANSGNTDAARIALFMQRHGKLLYGTDWAATDEDVELWSKMTGTRLPNVPERVASTAAAKAPSYKARMLRFIGRGEQNRSEPRPAAP
jgi:hypothetical protein